MSQTTTLRISGMTCKNCAAHVEEALSQLQSVEKASVDLKKALAKVQSVSALDLDAVRAALDEAGYVLEGVA